MPESAKITLYNFLLIILNKKGCDEAAFYK